MNNYLSRVEQEHKQREKTLFGVQGNDPELVVGNPGIVIDKPLLKGVLHQIQSVLKRCGIRGNVKLLLSPDAATVRAALRYNEIDKRYELVMSRDALRVLQGEPVSKGVVGGGRDGKAFTPEHIIGQIYASAGMARYRDDEALTALKKKTTFIKGRGDGLILVGLLGSLFKYRDTLSSRKIGSLGSCAALGCGVIEELEQSVLARAQLRAEQCGDAFALITIENATDMQPSEKIATLEALQDYWYRTGQDLDSDFQRRGIGYTEAIAQLKQAASSQ